MKQSRLKHSFDEVRLNEGKKREMLKNLKEGRAKRSSGLLVRPALALALAAVMIGGVYMGSRFLKDPGQNPGPTSASTQPDSGKGLPGLDTYHDTLVRVALDARYSVSPESWQEIREVLAKAEYDPKISAITMDLRENDLNLTSEKESRYFIREFSEIYYMDGPVFEAWFLKEEDSQILKELLQKIMQEGNSIEDPVEPEPAGDLQTIPTLDLYHDTLDHPLNSLNYSITPVQWEDLAGIFKNAVYDPDINAVTDDLREADLYLRGAMEEYLFVRDYREIYLSGSRFAAYTLDDSGSAALQAILEEIMTKENLKNVPGKPEEPASDPDSIPTLDMYHFRLHHPMGEKEYQVSTENWKVIREILTRAVYEPDWNFVTEELRDTDMRLSGSSDEHLFLRDYRQIYLTGMDRFLGYSLSEDDAGELEKIMESIMTPDNIYGQNAAVDLKDLFFSRMSKKDEDHLVVLTDKDRAALAAILERAEYVETLGVVEVIDATEHHGFMELLSEEAELILTRITENGDVFVQTGIAMSVDTKRNFHYRLSPEDLDAFHETAEKIFSRGSTDHN